MTDDPASTHSSPKNDPINVTDIQNLEHDAIAAALIQNWELAISINQKIIKINPTGIDALNRLGFAYTKLGKYKDARRMYGKVKSTDPYNQIALKNLDKIADLDEYKPTESKNNDCISPLLFLEDPGKTKVVQCVNVAPHTVLSTIHSSEEVYLKPKNHSVEIRDNQNRYLGALPDDLSFRLIKFISGNNAYSIHVRSVDKNALTVFIRELSRGKKFSNQPSFLVQNLYATYGKSGTSDAERPDVTATGEDDDAPDREEV